MQKYKDFIYYNRKELLIGLLCILALFNLFFKSDNKESIATVSLSDFEKKEEKVESKIIVDIKGEVIMPGTYEMNADDRVSDVLLKAGGVTDKASTENINLSEKVKDEMLIVIPSIDSNPKPVEEKKPNTTSNNSIVSDGKVSINKASIQELMTIKGIGESKAKAIIDYRSKNGLFKNIDEIKNVSGIGKSTFEKIKDYIKL